MNRPKTRGDCVNGPRPCPWVSCRHNLLIDISDHGTIKLTGHGSLLVKDGAPFQAHQDVMKIDRAVDSWYESNCESCALDVADRGEHTNDEVGEFLGLNRERARQVLDSALPKMSVIDDEH